MIRLYHLHPIAVHFPIALLLTGLAADGAQFVFKKTDWLRPATSALLWAGTLGLWVAFGLGHLAEHTAPHVPAAWEVFYEHELLASWTAGVFTALSLWRYFLASKWRVIFLVAWMAGASLIASTAFHGALLVYQYGMGTERTE